MGYVWNGSGSNEFSFRHDWFSQTYRLSRGRCSAGRQKHGCGAQERGLAEHSSLEIIHPQVIAPAVRINDFLLRTEHERWASTPKEEERRIRESR